MSYNPILNPDHSVFWVFTNPDYKIGTNTGTRYQFLSRGIEDVLTNLKAFLSMTKLAFQVSECCDSRITRRHEKLLTFTYTITG